MSTAIPDPGQASAYFGALERIRPVDLTAVGARADRDRLSDRLGVLDKVGVLRGLPGDFRATTEMVAEFYGVDPEAVKKVAQRHRDEFTADGLAIVRGQQLRDIVSLSQIDPRTPSLTLFPRRAVLRVGMLLRDSAVAHRVRDYLLNAESAARQVAPLTGEELMAAALLEAQKVLAERDARLAERSKSADAWDRLVEEGHTYKADDAAKILARDPSIGDLGQRRLQQFLAGDREINARKLPRPWLYRANGNGAYRPYQEQIGLGRLELKPGGRYFRGDKTHPKQGEPVVLITAKGLSDLRKFLTNSGQLALL
ncbi:phage antirepressor KilAC domain-containing protein [Mycolicibacterium sp.]|uniref:phage antirepressor KilAC domain-containing protein n=1 Tax=Mycolicibacterium sp. TaxID=2320850 RepID=UPI0037C5C13E